MKSYVVILVNALFLFSLFADIPLPGDGGSDSGELSNIDFRAYLESTIITEEHEDENILLNQNRARLDLKLSPEDSYSINLSIVGNSYSGETLFNMNNYLPPSLKDEADDFLYYEYEDEIKIQEAFASCYGNRFTFRIGRQKYYSGTGWAFNPVDLFNHKDISDPGYELDGIDIALLNIELTSFSNIDILVRAGDNYEKSDFQSKLKLYTGPFDFSMIYSNVMKERLNWENPGTEDSYGRAKWQMAGFDFSGDLFGLHLYGEAGWVFADEIENVEAENPILKDHERILAGFDYTFDFQLYIIAEYLRNGLGKDHKSDLLKNDFAAYYSGESISIMQDNLFSGFSFPVTDLIDFSFYNIISMNDLSALIYPGLSFSLGDGINAYMNVYFPYGDDDTAFGSSVLSALFRIKFSF